MRNKVVVFLRFNMGFIVWLYLDSGKHLVILCLYFLLYWSPFSYGVRGENLFNCTNLLHSGFCLGWPMVFLW